MLKDRLMSWSLAIALSWATTSAFAQDQAPAPSFKDGDTWQFNITAKGQRGTQSDRLAGLYELVFSQGQLKVYEVEGNKKTELEVKSEGPGSGMPSLIGIQNERPSLKFPLSVGQKWNYEYVNRPAGARDDQKYSVEVAVTGMEQIKTPAGAFKAYKLVRNQQTQVGQRAGSKRWVGTTITYFYSPETKSVVKSTSVNDETQATTDTELIKFTPGK